MNHVIITSLEEIDSLDFSPTLIVGFYHYENKNKFLELYNTFHKHFPHADIIGSSGESVIYNTTPHIDIDGTHRCTFVCLEMKKDAYSLQLLSSGEKPHINTDKNLNYSAIILESCYTNNTEKIITLLNDEPNINQFFGSISGLSSSDLNQGTIFYNGLFSSDKILLWIINENHYFLNGLSQHNFNPIGYSLEITHTEGYKLLEIENEPALDIIEKMIGTINPESLISFDHPFFITSKSNQNDAENSTPLSALLSIDREEKSITLYKKVRNGDKLKLAIPFSREKQESQLANFNQFHTKNSIAFLFVCISYKGHWREIEPIYLMHLAKNLNIPFIGFHSFGEIGPLRIRSTSLMQNQTLTLTVLSERSL